MDDKKMVRSILKYIVSVLILVFIPVCLQTANPVITRVSQQVVTLGASSSDTLTFTGLTLQGDSLGVQIEVNQDSISGEVRYQWVSVSGYTDTTQFAYLPAIMTFPNNSKGNFSYAIPQKSGASAFYLYLILTNNKTATQTVTTTIYTVRR